MTLLLLTKATTSGTVAGLIMMSKTTILRKTAMPG